MDESITTKVDDEDDADDGNDAEEFTAPEPDNTHPTVAPR